MNYNSVDIQRKGGNRCGSRRLDSCRACSRVRLSALSLVMRPAPTATADYLAHNSPPHGKKKLLNTGSCPHDQLKVSTHLSVCTLKVWTIRLNNKTIMALPGCAFSWTGCPFGTRVKATDEAILSNYQEVKERCFSAAIQSRGGGRI